MSAQHSPGPWVLEDIGDDRWRLADNDDNYIEFIHRSRYVDERHDPVQEANARLIAAAPRMLAALRWVRKNYAAGPTAEVNARIEAAIAEATGEGR